jgi:preprotein translocase subunit SecD
VLKFSRFKIFFIIVPCIWALFGALPHFYYGVVEKANDSRKILDNGENLTPNDIKRIASWPSWLPSRLINLGLDLRGGAHLLVEVTLEDVYQERLDGVWPEIRNRLRKLREEIGSIRRVDGRKGTLSVKIENKNALSVTISEINKLNKSFESAGVNTFDVTGAGNIVNIVLSENEKKLTNKRTLEQSLEIIRRRVDEAGTREPSIQRQGERRVLVQVPGIGSAEELLQLIGKTAKLTFNPVIARTTDKNTFVKSTSILIPGADENDGYYEISKAPVVSGDELTNAQPSFDQNNRPAVSFQFNPSGGRKFGSYTKNNIGTPFAIVLDNQVISAPVIQSHIPGGSGIITGNFSVEESNRLSILLRAGALPAEIVVLEQRTIGPELGADSVASGKIAAIIGGLLVLLFMFLTYGIFGIFANIALIVNIALIFSFMALIGATLTLPGIAGIVLTLGMAVDANVLVFERIKEETKVNVVPLKAIELGYEKALTSIIDANVTTMIAAVLLFILGTGPVRGFSVTLGIGIITSVFTAIFVTRLLIFFYFSIKRPKKLFI